MRGPFEDHRAESPFLDRLGGLRRTGHPDADCLLAVCRELFDGSRELKIVDGKRGRYLLFACNHAIRVYAPDRRRITFVAARPGRDPLEGLL